MKNYINDLIPYKDVDYCRYGYDYKKRTRFWTNIDFEPLLCNHKGKHKLAIGHKNNCSSLLQRYSIPQKLIEDIFNKISKV